MAHTLLRQKGRREKGSFALMPHAVMDSESYRKCSHSGIRLLFDLLRQYNGSNNGDLSAALGALKKRGWTRPETLMHAARELVQRGLIKLTRQGGLMNRPSLYALTWKPVNDCGGKLDCSPTLVPTGEWCQSRERYRRPKKKTQYRIPADAMPESGKAVLLQ